MSRLKDSIPFCRRIEEPVRGDSVKLDGGPPVGQRREARDDLFIQTDGSAEKQGA